MTLARRLLDWYRRHGRALPWRNIRDPYRILVSELMLQQTQVSRGLVFYPRWLARFPDWKTLAAASNADVIEAWAGLGYNRRALMLRDIAKAVVAKGVPTSAEGWQALKGIGPYSAAAIACFSLHERVLPIDTNIRRVLGRVLLGIPFPQPSDDEAIQENLDRVLPRQAFHDVPQALFDLATIACTKSPDCASCPLRSTCPCAPGFLAGTYAIPKQMVKKAKESRHRDKPYPDRIYRGRLLKHVREQKTVKLDASLGKTIDPSYAHAHDFEWLQAIAQRLITEGFLRKENRMLRLH